MQASLYGVVGVIVVALLFSQVGTRIAARNAVAWWLWLGLFMFSAVAAELLEPVAHFLGIAVVSNLIFASMIVFLLYHSIELQGLLTTQTRSQRRVVSRTAVRDFLQRNPNIAKPPSDEREHVLVVLPCLNERAAIGPVLERLGRLRDDDELVIRHCAVDDGSDDGTVHVLRAQAGEGFAVHDANIGVAGVLMTGFMLADELNYDRVVQCDGDGQHPIEAIPELVRAAIAADADILLGSRFAPHADAGTRTVEQASMTPLRGLGRYLLRIALGLFGAAHISDPTSGFRVYSKRFQASALLQMPDEYPEVELLAFAVTRHGRLAEQRVTMAPRATGTSHLRGLAGPLYMAKVLTALIGLRLRSLAMRREPLSDR
jgi:hypothetical protein